MTPEKQGRFCQSCSTTVIDFTAMTDAQMINWLTRQNGKTCGRFREDQLERNLRPVSSRASNWKQKTLVFCIGAWFGIHSAEAQNSSGRNATIELLPSSQPSVIPSVAKHDSSTISGMVIAFPAGGPTQIKIRLNDTVETSANELGHFSLPYSRTIPLEKQWLVISAVGYQTQRFRLADLNLGQSLQLALISDNDILKSLSGVLGGVSVSGIPTKSTNAFQSLYYRIEDFFR